MMPYTLYVYMHGKEHMDLTWKQPEQGAGWPEKCPKCSSYQSCLPVAESWPARMRLCHAMCEATLCKRFFLVLTFHQLTNICDAILPTLLCHLWQEVVQGSYSLTQMHLGAGHRSTSSTHQ